MISACPYVPSCHDEADEPRRQTVVTKQGKRPLAEVLREVPGQWVAIDRLTNEPQAVSDSPDTLMAEIRTRRLAQPLASQVPGAARSGGLPRQVHRDIQSAGTAPGDRGGCCVRPPVRSAARAVTGSGIRRARPRACSGGLSCGGSATSLTPAVASADKAVAMATSWSVVACW